jgi:CRP-like cAMP-binding protein
MVKINLFRQAEEAEMLPRDMVLFREGDPGDVMCAIVEGEVELTHHGALLGPRASDLRAQRHDGDGGAPAAGERRPGVVARTRG